jgi:hypothetical protein
VEADGERGRSDMERKRKNEKENEDENENEVREMCGDNLFGAGGGAGVGVVHAKRRNHVRGWHAAIRSGAAGVDRAGECAGEAVSREFLVLASGGEGG